MGLGDMMDKAKDLAGGDEKVDELIDDAAEAVKDKTPDQADVAVDKAAEAAKKAL